MSQSEEFEPKFLPSSSAAAVLSFESDREIVRKAIEIVTAAYHNWVSMTRAQLGIKHD